MEDVILHGDVYACLNWIEDRSISLAITSPPYWKQRDYGFEGQIGWEKTPEEYIGRLLAVFRILRRKLRDDGIFFLNIGDKYLHRYGKSHLLQIPYRLAYHMVKDGWHLEDIIIWYKPNHMPSSVKDRFTNTYEPILVFSKSPNNRYTWMGNVIKVHLQQTPWKHTAVFPEKLVEEMLRRFMLTDGDLILDPFAGTGTVAQVVKNLRKGLYRKNVYSIMIDKGKEFIDIIKQRVGIKKVVEIEDLYYDWEAVKEEGIPDTEPLEIINSKYGEIFIADDSETFLKALKGLTTGMFKHYHREDALYFFGVRKWDLRALYYIHAIFNEGYVLRNMIVISEGKKWFPLFMFASDTTRIEYRFYLDRVRIKPKTIVERNWWNENFTGVIVRDISRKKKRTGIIVNVLERYDDGFPMIVAVKWDETGSIEFVLHPEKDEIIMEGLIFRCPKCKTILEDPYDPMGENWCPKCNTKLWKNVETIPLIEEPPIITMISKKIETTDYTLGEDLLIKHYIINKRNTKSKFKYLDRINWGASPGARKTMIGEYFTKMRLYRIEQPIIAQYLNLIRIKKGLTVQKIIDKLPKEYKHTVGHWFRKDFGGSIPIPEDIPLLKKVLGIENGILKMIGRTALKFQTVKASVKGKNPGDFIEHTKIKDIVIHFQKLYLPSLQYLKLQST